jgi:hypothetical protein
MQSGGPEQKEVEIDGTIWETWWVPVDTNIYLHYAIDITEIRKTKRELQEAIVEIKTLQGILPICSSCKKIRDDKGYWSQIEAYIQKHSEATFSHGMCPECSDKLYGDKDWYIKMKKKKK